MSEWLDFLGPLVTNIGGVVDVFGIIVILAAAIEAAWKLVRLEMRLDKSARLPQIDEIKEAFVYRMIFGLDFLIAGDILKSVFAPTMDKLILIGGIVVVRGILSFSLINELKSDSRRIERADQA
ncbi:DUF1622 domain-containing protein [Candidatus Micrarchaeota archaeon]|nr:DUF1622 domain-containing protein [Candidatus Micrarchaeota archaeon]